MNNLITIIVKANNSIYLANYLMELNWKSCLC